MLTQPVLTASAKRNNMELVAVVICGLAVQAAVHRDTTTLPVLVVLSLLGFVGSVTVARFSPGSDVLSDADAEDAEAGARADEEVERP